MEQSHHEQPGGARYAQPQSAVEQVRDPRFPLSVRGYDRRAVEEYVAGVAQLVYELESAQSPEAAIQRALGEVGEQTTGILQRAHQTAEEITARAQIEADQQLRRADQEADQLRREAEAFAGALALDTRSLWEERQRLIEDIRQLADDVLAIADDASERLREPGLGHDAEADDETMADTGESPPVDADPPTGEIGPLPAEPSAGADDDTESGFRG